MYITGGESYYEGTEQRARRGWFLLLMQPDLGGWDGLMKGGKEPVRALLRKVALSQLGHFMMGFAHAAGHRLSISGAYGNDGLTMSVHPDVYKLGVDLPDPLYQMWSKGGGWNSAGSEAPALRRWSLANFDKLVPECVRQAQAREHTYWTPGQKIALVAGGLPEDMAQARVYIQSQQGLHVKHYGDSDAAAYAAWLACPPRIKAAFRAAGDATPVAPWDLVAAGLK